MTNDEFQRLVLEELKSIKEKVSRLDENVEIIEDVEAQLTETNALVKTLLRRDEELDAKFDEPTITKGILERIETKLDIINHRVLAQDGEIQLLKQAK